MRIISIQNFINDICKHHCSNVCQINFAYMMDINNYKIKNAPPTVYYIPNFISDEDEKHILSMVNSVPKPKWTQLAHRRLQNWGGIPHKNGMIAESIPDWLQCYINKVAELKLMSNKSPNHVLINEYLAGQGILSHLDGPLFYPTVTTISCGSHTILNFKRDIENGGKDICNILLEPKSLLILQDDMYQKYLHQIDEVVSDTINDLCVNLNQCSKQYFIGDELQRSTRISLTIRHVPKTSKIKLIL